MTSTKQYSLYGWQFVSKRCKDKKIGPCTDKIGCAWKGNRCEDASEWRCSVKKKILDCVMSKRMSPVDIHAHLDQYCGKLLLHQKKSKRRVCYAGVRMGEQCLKDSHCPASPAEWNNPMYDKSTKWNTTVHVTEGRYKGKRKYFKCHLINTRVGCVAAVMRDCSSMGLD